MEATIAADYMQQPLWQSASNQKLILSRHCRWSPDCNPCCQRCVFITAVPITKLFSHLRARHSQHQLLTGAAQHETPSTPFAQAVPVALLTETGFIPLRLAFEAKASGDPELRTVYMAVAEAVPLDDTAHTVQSTSDSADLSATATTGPATEGKTASAKRTYQGIVQLEKQARVLRDFDSIRHATKTLQALDPAKGSMVSAGTPSKGQGLKVQLQELVDKEAHVVAQMESKRLERDLHA